VKYALATVLSSLLALAAFGQKVTLPPKIEVKPGRIASITVEWDGDDIRYTSSEDLDVFREYDPDPKKVRLRVIGYQTGKYRLVAIASKGGKLSDFATCVVQVGDAPPPVPPTPPTPPDPPTPLTPPTPPAPIPADGFRVLMLYDADALDKTPAAQVNCLYAKEVRDYMRDRCAKKDGIPEWRIWPANVDATGEATLWQAAIKRPRSSLPWIIVSTGKSGYEGPLPESVEKTLELLKKYGG